MICRNCHQDLPKENFTSTRAKFCKPCVRIVALEKRNEMMQRSIDRAKTKKPKKQVVQSLPALKKRAQIIFNRWIRDRDKNLPCISCQKFCDNYDAGHFWAMGSNGALRYNEDNVHKQCSPGCNRYKSGNLLNYRLNLVKKIGLERVEWLDEHHTDIKKWNREELLAIIERYKKI